VLPSAAAAPASPLPSFSRPPIRSSVRSSVLLLTFFISCPPSSRPPSSRPGPRVFNRFCWDLDEEGATEGIHRPAASSGPRVFGRLGWDLDEEGAAEGAQWPAANPGPRVFGRLCWDLDEEGATGGRWSEDEEGAEGTVSEATWMGGRENGRKSSLPSKKSKIL
jgi:hypothetical protein